MGQIPIKLLGEKKDSKVNLKKDFGLDTTKLHFARFRHDLPHSGGRKIMLFYAEIKGTDFGIQYSTGYLPNHPTSRYIQVAVLLILCSLLNHSWPYITGTVSGVIHASLQCQVQSSVTEPRSPFF